MLFFVKIQLKSFQIKLRKVKGSEKCFILLLLGSYQSDICQGCHVAFLETLYDRLFNCLSIKPNLWYCLFNGRIFSHVGFEKLLARLVLPKSYQNFFLYICDWRNFFIILPLTFSLNMASSAFVARNPLVCILSHAYPFYSWLGRDRICRIKLLGVQSR